MIQKKAVDLTDLAIGIIVLGIVISIGANILIKYRDSQLTSIDTTQIANETLTTVGHTGENLAQSWVKSVNTCINSTDNVIIGSANYTVTVDSFGSGKVTFNAHDTALFNETDWKCTYTIYNKTDPRFSLPNNASIGLSEYGNWFKIIVIVGIASLILAIIFMSFGRSPSMGGSSSGGSY